MKAASEYLVEQLTSEPTIKSLVDTRVYPLVAREDVDYPFLTYQLIAGPLTKDTSVYRGIINAFYKRDQYALSLEAADAIEAFIKAHPYFAWEETKTDFIEENQSRVVSITFNFDY